MAFMAAEQARAGRLGDLLKIWEHLGQYADELLELIPLLKELRTVPGVAAKASTAVKIAKLFSDEIPSDIDDKAIALVEEYLKHPELVDKTEQLVKAIGLLREPTTTNPDPDFGFQTQP